MTKIDIRYPKEAMAKSRERMAAHREFRYVDRVPVVAGISARYTLQQRGVGFREFFNSPEAQVYHQLMNLKWRLENLREDFLLSPVVNVVPDFQNVVPAAFFAEATVVFDDETPPWVLPCIQDTSQVESLRVPTPTANIGLKHGEFFVRMREAVKEYEVTINGEPVPLNVSPGGMGGSNISAAIKLAGENVLAWMLECPEVVHRLLDKICRARLNFVAHMAELSGKPLKSGGGGGDGAEMLSPRLFREFMIPYYERCHQAGPNRGLHMCGRINHLLDVLMNDLKITSLDGFGSVADRQLVAEKMAGRIHLRGNVDCVVLRNGPREAIRRECFDALERLSRRGGFVLSDGHNIAPGTPVEHVNLMAACAEEFGPPALVRA
ncbi:MAG: hypothetical protein FJ279_28995 [Planctomycetes bacterium]|nr:hypothetical protein [Planctomycetota bacterium]